MYHNDNQKASKINNQAGFLYSYIFEADKIENTL